MTVSAVRPGEFRGAGFQGIEVVAGLPASSYVFCFGSSVCM